MPQVLGCRTVEVCWTTVGGSIGADAATGARTSRIQAFATANLISRFVSGRRNLSASACAFPVQAVICTYPCPPMSSAVLRRTSLLRERGLSDLKRRGLGLMEVRRRANHALYHPSIHRSIPTAVSPSGSILSSCLLLLVRPRLFVRLQVKLCATYPHTFPLIVRKSGVEI